MIYWGEGFKTNWETGIGNADPAMLVVFLGILRKNYQIPVEQIRCELYLRADQDAEVEKKFWAKTLDLPLGNFRYVSFDKRTEGSETRPTYHGVCALRCANVAIQRKLLNISKGFSDYIIKRV